MRVIKAPPTRPEGERCTCRKCGAVLEYGHKDVVPTNHGEALHVVCVFCDSKIDVTPDDRGH